ncbi:MBL fold metallo-hydrolase [Actinophytocola sp.]|uniref:MBL fold metallo-hydrolase n=1 Tax=Actinophytocola sp. TaxID=1872138 RepID=UPI002D7FF4A3|nr:MBL fold metallo-hydrolase [Actinophytocola sp.]HET9142899.1 MBL fold metallo-hydrolase [Actinophytocola sp.]HEU5109145.1 MBL fold metallo-hydrolase [Micromonosporaceae bacterium]
MPAIPDQPDDWTEPGSFPVAPGVYRIPLPLPSDALRAVNVYAIDDPDGLVLVDSGWALEQTEKALAAGLRGLGYDLGDIARIAVTHAHGDHYTQALALRTSYGTRVSLGTGERESIERLRNTDLDAYSDQYAQLRRYGAGDLADKLTAWAGKAFADDRTPWGRPDTWLADGERIGLADRTLDVIATPGHTQGHVVFRDAPAGLLFAGDHILPHITPSIGFEAVVPVTPLRDYLDSLRLVRDLPDTVLLPAHGPVTLSVHRRVDELLDHHEVRLAMVLREVQRGLSTAFEVAGALRWTRRERTLDELDLFNQMLAVIETGAHLDVLVLQGELRGVVSDGVGTYSV